MTSRPEDLSFLDHLDELKGRVIKSVVVVLIVSCFFYAMIDVALAWVIKPVGRLIFTYPAEAFLVRISLTLLGGCLLSLPFIFYQIWQFVSLGLNESEKKYVKIFGPCSLFCFALGGVFGYFVMVPVMMTFLLGFASNLIVPMLTVSKYISFVGSFVLIFGIIFELPLVIMFLTKIGIATPEFLTEKRKHAIVLFLIIGALLTPSDVLSQLLVAVPLILLFEVGILFSRLTVKKRR